MMISRCFQQSASTWRVACVLSSELTGSLKRRRQQTTTPFQHVTKSRPHLFSTIPPSEDKLIKRWIEEKHFENEKKAHEKKKAATHASDPRITTETATSTPVVDVKKDQEKKRTTKIDAFDLFRRRYFSAQTFSEAWECVYSHEDLRPWEITADGGVLEQALAAHEHEYTNILVPGCGVAHGDMRVLMQRYPEAQCMAVDLATGSLMFLSEHLNTLYKAHGFKTELALVHGDFFLDDGWTIYFDYPSDVGESMGESFEQDDEQERAGNGFDKDNLTEEKQEEEESGSEDSRDDVERSTELGKVPNLGTVGTFKAKKDGAHAGVNREMSDKKNGESDGGANGIHDRSSIVTQSIPDEKNETSGATTHEEGEPTTESDDDDDDDDDGNDYENNTENGSEKQGRNGFDFIYDRNFFTYLPTRRRKEWGNRMFELLSPENGRLLTLIDNKPPDTARGPPFPASFDDYDQVLSDNGLILDGDIVEYDDRFQYCFWKRGPLKVEEEKHSFEGEEEEDLEWK